MLFSSFIHYLFCICILSSLFRHVYRDWSISYLASHLNLPSCIYYFVHDIYFINSLSVRNIGFIRYFLTSICSVVILIFSLAVPLLSCDEFCGKILWLIVTKAFSMSKNTGKLILLSSMFMSQSINPPMVKPFRLTYLAKGGGGGEAGCHPTPSTKMLIIHLNA